MDSIWIEVVLIAVGILANGFFAGSEIALISARTGRLAQLREARVAGAATAMQLKESPDTFLATIQIAITAVGTLASAVGGAAAVEALTPSLVAYGLGRWAEPLALTLVIVVITYVSLVIGELTPKAVALRNPERLAALVAPTIAVIARMSSGLVRLLTASTNGLLRAAGLGASQTSPFVSEEEVRYLVREGAAKGIFEKVEEELVHNVFEFADTTVREIMTPRQQIKGVDIATPPEEILARAAEVGHSRMPVYHGSPEQVAGIVTLKDVIRAVARGESPAFAALLRPAVFVPETARISGLLREFQRTREGLAVVVDEYGSVAGLVTVEDVVEEIVGDIGDEGEPVPALITRLPDGRYVMDGAAPVDEVERALGVTLPPSRDYTTAAGFVLATLGSVPTPGTSLVAAGHRWTVVEMDGPRIRRVSVQAA
jgi:putative hemolysin